MLLLFLYCSVIVLLITTLYNFSDGKIKISTYDVTNPSYIGYFLTVFVCGLVGMHLMTTIFETLTFVKDNSEIGKNIKNELIFNVSYFGLMFLFLIIFYAFYKLLVLLQNRLRETKSLNTLLDRDLYTRVLIWSLVLPGIFILYFKPTPISKPANEKEVTNAWQSLLFFGFLFSLFSILSVSFFQSTKKRLPGLNQFVASFITSGIIYSIGLLLIPWNKKTLYMLSGIIFLILIRFISHNGLGSTFTISFLLAFSFMISRTIGSYILKLLKIENPDTKTTFVSTSLPIFLFVVLWHIRDSSLISIPIVQKNNSLILLVVFLAWVFNFKETISFKDAFKNDQVARQIGCDFVVFFATFQFILTILGKDDFSTTDSNQKKILTIISPFLTWYVFLGLGSFALKENSPFSKFVQSSQIKIAEKFNDVMEDIRIGEDVIFLNKTGAKTKYKIEIKEYHDYADSLFYAVKIAYESVNKDKLDVQGLRTTVADYYNDSNDFLLKLERNKPKDNESYTPEKEYLRNIYSLQDFKNIVTLRDYCGDDFAYVPLQEKTDMNLIIVKYVDSTERYEAYKFGKSQKYYCFIVLHETNYELISINNQTVFEKSDDDERFIDDIIQDLNIHFRTNLKK